MGIVFCGSKNQYKILRSREVQAEVNRGFITIATGSEHYYKLAANLLQSYRHFSPHPYPFAILAEEENQYTAQFDDVILIDDSTHSFMDKLLLLKYCPYDETIFVDADSLVYGDLNQYWDLFANATDFSAIGINVPRDQEEGVWYNIEDIGEYGKRISYKVRVHSGVCFIRQSEKLSQLYDDCLDIIKHYDELNFHQWAACKDECTLGLAMPLNEMKAVKAGTLLVTYPLATYLNADLLHGKLQYSTEWQGYVEKGLLLHWGTLQTYTPLYEFEASCLHHMINRRNDKPGIAEILWYEKRLLYRFLLVKSLFRKVSNRIRRALKHITAQKSRT